MDTLAVVMQQPGSVELSRLSLHPTGSEDLVVAVSFSGISSGTERLLYRGDMPPFPGMGYPLVPGYETVGVVVEAPTALEHRIGEHVFVSGAHCYGDVRGLFGGAASHLSTAPDRAVSIGPDLGSEGVLLALAATAHHAVSTATAPPELVVGHGVLGRLIARVAIACGHPPPVVWEQHPDRRAGAEGYPVIAPEADTHMNYSSICDASGDPGVIDTLVARLAPRGELVLAGFYPGDVRFAFPPAFMTEARFAISAEWAPEDLAAVLSLVDRERLSLAGLISHCLPAREADRAYATAFGDPECVKMILDWGDVE